MATSPRSGKTRKSNTFGEEWRFGQITREYPYSRMIWDLKAKMAFTTNEASIYWFGDLVKFKINKDGNVLSIKTAKQSELPANLHPLVPVSNAGDPPPAQNSTDSTLPNRTISPKKSSGN